MSTPRLREGEVEGAMEEERPWVVETSTGAAREAALLRDCVGEEEDEGEEKEVGGEV